MGSPQKHADICTELNRIYTSKNAAYGDAFGETFEKLGIISAITRMTDKLNRLQTLALNPDIDRGDESLTDTCMDLANYAIMTVMQLRKE